VKSDFDARKSFSWGVEYSKTDCESSAAQTRKADWSMDEKYCSASGPDEAIAAAVVSRGACRLQLSDHTNIVGNVCRPTRSGQCSAASTDGEPFR
jgi:hypothetical protein